MMNPDSQTQHTAHAEVASTIDLVSAPSPRHAFFSQPLVDTEAIIDATLKKHYGFFVWETKYSSVSLTTSMYGIGVFVFSQLSLR
jgi:hypothetical protein